MYKYKYYENVSPEEMGCNSFSHPKFLINFDTEKATSNS